MTERDRTREELDEALSALLDGELDPADAQALRARLEQRPDAAARLEALGAVDAALRGLSEPEVPRDLLARVRADADAPRPSPLPRAPRHGRRWVIAGALAASAVAALLAVSWVPGLRPEAPAPLAPRWERAPQPALDPLDLDAVSGEELLLAMDLETLEDLDLVEHLDLLEQLDALEGSEQG